jgi:hypothetical protein
MTDWNAKHRKVDHSKEEWVRGIVHTNTIEGVWSLLKRSVVGPYHQLSAKHLPAYLDEMAFRFNNRDNPYLFRDTLLRMIEGETLPYAELVADAETHRVRVNDHCSSHDLGVGGSGAGWEAGHPRWGLVGA